MVQEAIRRPGPLLALPVLSRAVGYPCLAEPRQSRRVRLAPKGQADKGLILERSQLRRGERPSILAIDQE